MVVTGITLFVVLMVVAVVLMRRGRDIGGIVAFVLSGVVLGGTTLGPPLHRAASAAVNGLVNAFLGFVQSL